MRFLLTLCLLLTSETFAKSCVFCRQDVLENESVFVGKYFTVLMDIEPRAAGHMLAVSNRHIMKADELTAEEWSELGTIIPKVVEAFHLGLNTDQYVLLEKNGPRAFQDVPHVHFHLVPVQNQAWEEIFNICPKRLSIEEFRKEICFFRGFFPS